MYIKILTTAILRCRVPGEIKRSRDLRGGEVELDPHFCPEEIMSRDVELG